jgi:hypothetical protein
MRSEQSYRRSSPTFYAAIPRRYARTLPHDAPLGLHLRVTQCSILLR